MIQRLHPVTWLIIAAIVAWLISDSVLLAYALYHPAQHLQTTGWSLGRFVQHLRKDGPQLVLNITGAVVVECLARVWSRLRAGGRLVLEKVP